MHESLSPQARLLKVTETKRLHDRKHMGPTAATASAWPHARGPAGAHSGTSQSPDASLRLSGMSVLAEASDSPPSSALPGGGGGGTASATPGAALSSGGGGGGAPS
eukprot:CAMPEP_0175795942 /NCGR_PEP_ID=MMETSP0097-20121207/84723_1 /TAXON_ID=311494 /ORGANISM="Alexandrium monilatum, Strain CCMP3105" /LENGTH=105 /DNA_ID=CAMNT_0017107139 /DNA_START=32 /DNA_END=346 /DNA_ORIENTATION=+